MDQQIWPFFWALAALFLAVAFHFIWKKSSRVSNGASVSSSQSESPAENQPSAASSSSNSALPVEFEAFLSFRGPDVRANFADVLHKFLDRFKIRTFLDNEELRKGEIIAPSLEKAIKESKVYIPILSQDYASSKWCLQELALMVKCCKQGDDRIILPIFYMMEPRDVRHQEGSYKKAFQLHSKKYDAETIKEWKEALKEVGEMKGWSVKESDRQGVIVDEVYSKVWSHLMRSYKLVTEDLVGIDSHVQQVTTLLSLESGGVKIVGIHAMGGMGKTTIAKAVYDQLYSQFDRFCFVEDAREILSKSDGVVTLQNKIISSILITDYKVKDASEGLRVINDRVCKHKVLVVLDDVNDSSHFDQIMGKLDNFSPGSRFIITTRDKWVLQVLQECEFYEPKEMNDDHALQLFSKHAFGIDVPPTDYATLSLEFVKVAAGLPLALKVIGSLLFRRKREFWASKLMELKEIPPTKLIERGAIGLKFLELRWEMKTLSLQTMNLRNCQDYDILKSIPSDLNMKKLVILEMINCPVKDEWRGWSGTKVASNLKAIHLDFCPEIRTAPDFSQCRNLEWIDLDGCWNMSGEIHIGNLLKNLKLLRFTWTAITKLTGDIGALQNLQVLDAGNLVGKSFSPEIMNLPTSLTHLSVSFFRVLNLSELEDLEELCFDDCDKLQYLGGLWKLSNLRKLVLNYSSSCNSLLVEGEDVSSTGFPLPSSLNSLEISDLESLPNFANLNNLTELKLKKFQVPEIQGLGDLIMLETLEIYDALNLINLDGLESLSHLKTLNLEDCLVLEKLPISLVNLTKLQELSIKKCRQLAEVMGLERLEALRSLSMTYCSSITKFPDLSALTNLKTLDITGCTGLIEVMGIGRLESLRKLNMSCCGSVKELPDLSGLRNMISLDISECNQLKEVTGIGSLELLEVLGMINCTSIKKLPDLSGCKRLDQDEKVNAAAAYNLIPLSSVEELPDLSGLGKIESLDISECNQLEEVTGIESLELLEELRMRNCTSVKKLSDLSGCKKLRQLDIRGCVQLAEVSGIDKLKGLTVYRRNWFVGS
ncbi:Disease resistance protein L6 [Linum perenne]